MLKYRKQFYTYMSSSRKPLALNSTFENVTDTISIYYDDYDNEYWSAQDLNKFVPSKRVDHFMQNQDTIDYVTTLEHTMNISAIIRTRGRGAKMLMHRLLALRFAAWLSKDFELHVYRTYDEQRKYSDEWSKERIITKYEFHLLTDTIKDYIAPHYSQDKQGIPYGMELGMINRIIFGANKSSTTKSFRDIATPEQLREIVELQRHDKTLIMLGLSLEEREKLLSKLLGDIRFKYTKQLQQH